MTLSLFSDSEVCELLQGERVLRFYRVSDQDKFSFPHNTFDSLVLDDIQVTSPTDLRVTWSVGLDFYFTEFDWGLVFREIGDDGNPNMFFKVPPLLNEFCNVFYKVLNFRQITI